MKLSTILFVLGLLLAQAGGVLMGWCVGSRTSLTPAIVSMIFAILSLFSGDVVEQLGNYRLSFPPKNIRPPSDNDWSNDK